MALSLLEQKVVARRLKDQDRKRKQIALQKKDQPAKKPKTSMQRTEKQHHMVTPNKRDQERAANATQMQVA
jgi:hypothetical protein